MERQPLPYENLGRAALDSFGELLAYIFLLGLALVLLLFVVWMLAELFKKAGWYKPTGPVERRMGQLLVLTVLLVILVGESRWYFFGLSWTRVPSGLQGLDGYIEAGCARKRHAALPAAFKPRCG